MFHNETRLVVPARVSTPNSANLDQQHQVLPIVEYLRTQHMSANTPCQFILLVFQPLMTKRLDIKVMNLKTRMMNMGLRAFKEEEAVMIYHLLSSVQMHECGDITPIFVVYHITWLEIKSRSEEIIRSSKICDA